MKFVHISDLHIGKRVNGFSMLEDQKYILKQILGIIRAERPQGVLLAGDIYDKAAPSAEAVQVFDEFLTELMKEDVYVFIISGNHDSPERIAYLGRLLDSCGVFLSPVYDGEIKNVSMQDEYGQVRVWLLPFLKPAVVRHVLEKDIASYDQGVWEALDRIEVDPDVRNVLVAHQFVAGAVRSDSEELTVGGLDQVDAGAFERFDYVALGHLHRPQFAGKESLRYSGTPLKYSFSEAAHEKSVTVVELEEKGKMKIRTVPLKPLRDMRKIRGTYEEVTARDFYKDTNVQDYVHITLTDEEEIPHAMAKLRAVYPNLMGLQYDNRRTRNRMESFPEEAVRLKSEQELFEEFYAMQNGQPMNPQQKAFMEQKIRRMKEEKE